MSVFDWIAFAIVTLAVVSFIGQISTVIWAWISQKRAARDMEQDKKIQQLLLPIMNYSKEALARVGNPFKSFSPVRVSKVLASHLELISGDKRDDMFQFLEDSGFLDNVRKKLNQTTVFSEQVILLKMLSLSPHPGEKNIRKDADLFKHFALSPDNAVSITACFALAKLDKQIYLKELVEILRSRKKCSWLYIAQAMRLSRESFPKCISGFIKHPSPKIRKACASSIKYISNPIDPKILTDLIKNAVNEQVKLQALKTLMYLKHSVDLEVLGVAFGAKSKDLRLLGIQFVQQSGSKMMIIPLMENLYSSDWDISYNAGLAILSMGSQGKMLLDNLLRDHPDSSAGVTARLVLEEKGLRDG